MSSSSAARALGEAMVFEARQELQPAVDKFQALQRLGNSAPPPSICSDTHPFSNTLSSLPQGSSTATPNSPAPSSNSPLDLIQHLSKRSTKIVRYLSSTKPVEFGLVPECIGNNPRVVQHDTGSRSSTSKFREGLARRSLALSFCRWQFEIYGTSRVGELANNLSAAQTRQDGYIKQYLDANSNRFPDQRARKAATDKISLGTKYLVFELLLRIKSISAILIFEHSRFRGIKFEKLNDLMNLVRSTSWIMELAKRREKWFDECLEQYNTSRRLYLSEGVSRKRRRLNSTATPVDSFNSQQLCLTASVQTKAPRLPTTSLERSTYWTDRNHQVVNQSRSYNPFADAESGPTEHSLGYAEPLMVYNLSADADRT